MESIFHWSANGCSAALEGNVFIIPLEEEEEVLYGILGGFCLARREQEESRAF